MAYEYKSFLEAFFYTAVVESGNKDIYCESPSTSKVEDELDKVIEKFAKTREENNELFDAAYAVATDYRAQGFENGFKLGMKLAAAAFFNGSKE